MFLMKVFAIEIRKLLKINCVVAKIMLNQASSPALES